MSDEKRGRGRPTKYNPEIHLPIAQGLAKHGLTTAQLADAMDVATSTLSKWMAENPDFSEAIKEAKEYADQNVEASLYQRATGYRFKAVKIFMPANAPAPVYAPYVEHVPPDTTAMIFWLKNRKPKRWRDKQEFEHSGAIDLSAMTPEQLQRAQDEFILKNADRIEKLKKKAEERLRDGEEKKNDD